MTRLAVFLLIVLSVWTLMHVYAITRVWGLPPVAQHPRMLLLVAALLWLSYPLARILAPRAGRIVFPLEVVGATWVGVLFLSVALLAAADAVTAFGWLLPAKAALVRSAAVLTAGVLSIAALAQGLRPPVVRDVTVRLRDLPRERDGLVIVQLSDLHLGPLLARRWLEARIGQVASLQPDLVVVTGDLVDQDARKVEDLVPTLRRLAAPLGVWAVTGNHEFYAGLDRSVRVLREAGFRVLRDGAAEAAPGLVIAGVDDLTARRQMGMGDRFVEKALEGRPAGATLLLCHSPLEVDTAARLGVGLMLSGHTHNGQIWPFNYVVGLSYRPVTGVHRIGDMTVVVSRGTGFWGPPMRLFRPAEIVRITLRAA